MHLLACFGDRLTFLITWVFLRQRSIENEWHDIWLPLIMTLHFATSTIGSAWLWRWKKVSSDNWFGISAIYTYCMNLVASFIDEPWFWLLVLLVGGLLRPETPSFVGLFYDMTVTKSQIRKQVIARQFMYQIASLIASLIAVCIITYGDLILVFYYSSQIYCILCSIISLFIKEDGLISHTPVRTQLNTKLHESTLTLLSAILLLGGAIALASTALDTYVALALFTQVDYSITYLPVTQLVFGIVAIVVYMYSVPRIGLHKIKGYLYTSCICFLVATLSSVVVYMITEKSSPIHLLIHLLVLIPMAVLQCAPVLLLHEAQQHMLVEQRIYTDQLLTCMYMGNGLGILLALFQYLYQGIAPYLIILFALWYSSVRYSQAYSESLANELDSSQFSIED